MRITIVAILLASAALAAELPPHAHDAGGGWWECDRGYLMRNRACVSEAAVDREPRMIISSIPSAGEGSRQASTANIDRQATVPQPARANDWFVFIPAPIAHQHSALFDR